MANSHEIYNGKAKILAADGRIPTEKEQARMPERDRDNALFLIYDCETAEQPPRTYRVEVEISHRELTGKALEWNRREDGQLPTQVDVAVRDLKRQGLLDRSATEADIINAIAQTVIGQSVTIRVTEDEKPDGTYWAPRAKFVSPLKRITGSALADRLKAFREGRPAGPMVSDAPNAALPPAPADDDADLIDMPF